MKFLKFLILLVVASSIYGQNKLPNLELAQKIDYKNDVQKTLKLKNNDIAVSFYTSGGMAYRYDIDNFIFRENGNVDYFKESIYFKHGKKYKKKKISLTNSEKMKLEEIIQSDFFIKFSKFTQQDFKYSSNNHQICAGNFVDDAPENFLMISQKKKQTNIMVYLPKNNLKCSDKDSPLAKFVKMHNLFGIELVR